MNSVYKLKQFQERIAYFFKDQALLVRALTHRSHSASHNERLEFLGDSILNCVVAQLLYQAFEGQTEGDLSRLRANLVKQDTLHQLAKTILLSDVIRLGEGELRSGGISRPSILADAFEALVAAIFLDGGFLAAYEFLKTAYSPLLTSASSPALGKDAKTRLQEWLQAKHLLLPNYKIVATRGAAHNQEFEVECVLTKFDIRVRGVGTSRRAAEQAAAAAALECLMQPPTN